MNRFYIVLAVLVLFGLVEPLRGQDQPPAPPNWKSTRPYTVLLSPKAASVQVSARMAGLVDFEPTEPELQTVRWEAYVVLDDGIITNYYDLSQVTNHEFYQVFKVIGTTTNQHNAIEVSTNLVDWLPVSDTLDTGAIPESGIATQEIIMYQSSAVTNGLPAIMFRARPHD